MKDLNFTVNLERLKTVIASGEFHHATYRQDGLWTGWAIYVKEDNGFNGFHLDHTFFGADNDQERQVHNILKDTGYSVGSYGRG